MGRLSLFASEFGGCDGGGDVTVQTRGVGFALVIASDFQKRAQLKVAAAPVAVRLADEPTDLPKREVQQELFLRCREAVGATSVRAQLRQIEDERRGEFPAPFLHRG